MFPKLFAPFRRDLQEYTKKQKLFSLFVLISIFLIMAEYGMSAPVSSSLFIFYFSAHSLPYVWLFTVPLNFLVVAGYNKLLPLYGPKKTFLFTLLVVSLINFITAFFVADFPYLIFFQYAFRDVYILLLFKQIWSMIHATMDVSKAKYLYSLPFIVGSIGAIVGSLIPAYLAFSFGSSKLFFLTTFIYSFLSLFYKMASKRGNPTIDKELFSQKTTGGFTLIKNSKYLVFILLLVMFMQITVALIYYEFNLFLDVSFSNSDLRTQYMGKIHFLISSTSLFMQVFVSAILIRFLGLKRSHLLVPITLFCNSLFFLFKPTLFSISYLYASVKSLDFSFFCLIRERLYVPLSIDEKYRAKAVIDIFVYRSSKALASFALIFLPIHLSFPIIYISLSILILWIITTILIFREKKQIAQNPS